MAPAICALHWSGQVLPGPCPFLAARASPACPVQLAGRMQLQAGHSSRQAGRQRGEEPLASQEGAGKSTTHELRPSPVQCSWGVLPFVPWVPREKEGRLCSAHRASHHIHSFAVISCSESRDLGEHVSVGRVHSAGEGTVSSCSVTCTLLWSL